MSSKDTDEGRVIHSKGDNIETTIDPIQDGPFRGCPRMGGGKKVSLPP